MKLVAGTLLLALGTTAIVFPNSLAQLTLLLLVVLAGLAVLLIRARVLPRALTAMMFASALVTLFYALIGSASGAPDVAIYQVVIIYILSPIMWSLALAFAVKYFGSETLVRAVAWFSVPTVISIAVYFYLFLNFGPSAVTFFIETGNVHLDEGVVAARLHSYGSLIFLTGGLVAAPGIIRGRFLPYLVLAMVLAAVFTSGRAALMLSIPIGGLVFLGSNMSRKIRLKSFVLGVGAAGLALLVFGAFLEYFDLSFRETIDRLSEKLQQGGGREREVQALALLEATEKNYGFGAGHGIGTDVVRSYEYPWRYELVWLATIHRVGFFGALIYALPFLLYSIGMARALFLGNSVPPYQRFLFGGFLAAFVASATNPYIESFVLQWMFVLPVLDWYASRWPDRQKRRQFKSTLMRA